MTGPTGSQVVFYYQSMFCSRPGIELGPGCAFHLREWTIEECKEVTSTMSEERKLDIIQGEFIVVIFLNCKQKKKC